MASVIRESNSKARRNGKVPPLENGDRLSRDEFERRYSAMPNLKKAELIEGVVYMPSAVANDHSFSQFTLITFFGTYWVATPGVAGGDNGTLRLDLDNAPQPDGFLRVLESHGGQSSIDAQGFIAGAPELVGEISASSASIDLNSKQQVYRRNGVQEYLVWRVLDRAVDWFVLRSGQYERLAPSAKGVYKSEVFPGLWLDTPALLRGDARTVLTVLHKGLASRQHAAFVKSLAARAAHRK